MPFSDKKAPYKRIIKGQTTFTCHFEPRREVRNLPKAFSALTLSSITNYNTGFQLCFSSCT